MRSALLVLGMLVFLGPAAAQSVGEIVTGEGVTITHGTPGPAPTPCNDDPNLASNDCPGDIEIPQLGMEPAPPGMMCAEGYVFSADRTECQKQTAGTP